MRGAHADGKARAAGALHKLHGLVGIGVGIFALDCRAVVFLAANLAKLGLHGHAHGGTGIGNQLGEDDVVLEQLMAAIDHDRGVAGTKSLHAAVIAVTMIQVQRHGNLGALGRSLDHAVEVIETGSLNGARSGRMMTGDLVSSAALSTAMTNSRFSTLKAPTP